MFWFLLTHAVAFLVDLVTALRRTDRDKDLQILLLQHQVRLLQRQRPPPRLTRAEKLTLAVLTSKLARLTAGPRSTLERYVLLCKPDTVLRWHRELVRRKWTVRRQSAGGRPATPAEVEALILRLARDNAGWGYSRIHGELTKLGYRLGRSSVRDILQRHRVPGSTPVNRDGRDGDRRQAGPDGILLAVATKPLQEEDQHGPAVPILPQPGLPRQGAGRPGEHSRA